ncbi:THAP domain-containing protein 4 [Plakobranchus ocellatus]|uniref:THAP domain-containing protein 4 n=1 Tax=Plakobranchus ocellatus TaxID=259542 RepID=A0AAV4AUP0_9GAST|nr:THAP domain-containing protein 4 [Plakobranchus ocellatus]
MVQNCCVVYCSNRQTRGASFTFHTFPWRDSNRLAAWISRINRKNPDGSDWYPKPRDKICSAHFVEEDFFKEHAHAWLKTDAVPSIFPNFPSYKQTHVSRKKQNSCNPSSQSEPILPISPSTSASLDHVFNYPSVEVYLQSTKIEPDLSFEKAIEAYDSTKNSTKE